MMKVYKFEVMVVDFENLGAGQIKVELERSRYLMANVMSVDSKEIGEWSDDHLLNHTDTMTDEFKRLFASTTDRGNE